MTPEEGDDVNAKHRPFWVGIGFTLGMMCLVQGANYVATGNARALAANYYILTHNLPGGMRTWGYVLLTVGGFLLYNLKSDTKIRRVAVSCFCGASLFMTTMQFGALMVTPERSTFNYAPPAAWAAFAAVSALMIVYPPPPGGSDDV